MQDGTTSDLSKVCGRLGDRAVNIVLTVRLLRADGYYLEFRCACGHTCISPVKLLIGRLGGQHRIADILDRAVCNQCGARYSEVFFNETHTRVFNYGEQPGWSVQLRPAVAIATAEAAE